MKLGVTLHATDLSMRVPDLAREAEARGFYSLYIPEHTHIPTSRRTPPPTGESEALRGSISAASIPTSRWPPRQPSPRRFGSEPGSAWWHSTTP